MSEIDGILPDDALKMYLDERRREVSEATLNSHEYRLNHFVQWMKETPDIEKTDDLTGRRLHEFKMWRRKAGELNNVSMHTQLSTLRVFIQFLERVDAVHSNLHESIDIPSLNGDDQRSSILSKERADAIESYLERYEYASMNHVIFRILWRTGMRIGTLASLDVSDYNRTERKLHVRHSEETPLKKKEDGERIIALNAHTCAILDDWIDDVRPNVTDEYGREPLICTDDNRAATSTLRRHVYRLTQPCLHSECPHDTTPDECEVAGYTNKPSGCPSIRPPHDIRRGAITHFLSQNDIPIEAIRDRSDVSEGVLEDHYDVRSEDEKAEQRREHFSDE